MLSLDITPISAFFLAFGLLYLLGLAYIALLHRRSVAGEGEATDHVFSLIVPARNEAAVLGRTLNALLCLDYPTGKFEILVIDDGSKDRTAEIASSYARLQQGHVSVLQIPTEESGNGKGSALNRGFLYLLDHSAFQGDPRWIVGIFDADGRPESDMLKKASHRFRDARVGGVQASVRIHNRGRSWLTRMQDIEFAGFARVTQIIRTRIASSASLGGNGQFVRASALEEVALDRRKGLYWNPRALTEDLDLSARLAIHNWDLHQLNHCYVWQEGVETASALMRQRTRWAWGSLQVFTEYVLRLKVLRVRKVELRKRLDLLFNLSMFLVSPLVLVTWIVSGFAFLGLVTVLSAFPGPVLFLLSFAYLPVIGYGLSTVAEYRKARLPIDLLGFALYTYHWIPCLYMAMWHLASRHLPTWWKTSRTGEASGS